LVLGLYLLAFLLPSFADGPNAPIGVVAFFWALLGLLLLIPGGQHIPANPGFALILFLTWSANPVFWVGVWLLAKQSWHRAAWAGTLAVVLGSAIAVSSLLTKPGNTPPRDAPRITVVNPDGSKKIVESPARGVPNAWRPIPLWGNSIVFVGYYVWLLSMVLLAASGWIGACSAATLRETDTESE
jgi:hypothetical protein